MRNVKTPLMRYFKSVTNICSELCSEKTLNKKVTEPFLGRCSNLRQTLFVLKTQDLRLSIMLGMNKDYKIQKQIVKAAAAIIRADIRSITFDTDVFAT